MLLLIAGLFLFGLGEALLVAAGIGVSPWTVFAEGVMVQTHWSLGFATFLISLGVLLLWIPLKRTPGIGTVLNVLIIAAVLEYVLPWLPQPVGIARQSLLAIAGVLAQVRGVLEVSVVAIGWLLGGTVGLGTLLFAFGIGPSVALGLYAMARIFSNEQDISTS